MCLQSDICTYQKNHKEVQNMVLHFYVTKDKRKAMVQAIEKEIGGKGTQHTKLYAHDTV